MKVFKRILLVVLVLAILLAAYLFKVNQEVQKVEIDTPAFAELADGTYKGQAELGPVKVETATQIKDGRITSIEILRHENGLGQPAEKIINQVIDQQSLEVDVISGATASSKTILKSIETGLKGE